MVTMDTRLPLMIQQPNVLAALDAGTTAAANQAGLMRQAEGQNIFRQHGAAAMRGDQNALAAIGAFDPMMGQEMQAGQLRMQLTREQITNIRRQAAEAARAQTDQAALRAELAQGKQARALMLRGLATQDPELFRQGAAEFDMPDLEMNEQSVIAVSAMLAGIDDSLRLPTEGLFPKAEAPLSPQGKLAADLAAGRITKEQFDAATTPRGTSLSVTPDGAITFSDGALPGATVLDRANLQSGSGQVRVTDETSPTKTRLVAEPGSDAARAEEDRKKAAEAAAENARTRVDVVTKTTQGIRDLLKDKGFWNRVVTLDPPEAGIFGERFRSVSQERVDLEGRIDTLKGMVAFDRLEKMKAASSTGASGLGQVTEREIALLAAQLGALDANLSPEVIRETLNTVERVFGRLSPEAQAYLLGTSDVEPWGGQGATQPPQQGGEMPDFLSETDRMIWDVLDERERQIILRSYEGQR